MVMDVKDRRPRRRRRRRRHRRDRRWDRHVSGARSIAVDWQKEGQMSERAHCPRQAQRTYVLPIWWYSYYEI